jgi:hypothetical protein
MGDLEPARLTAQRAAGRRRDDIGRRVPPRSLPDTQVYAKVAYEEHRDDELDEELLAQIVGATRNSAPAGWAS